MAQGLSTNRPCDPVADCLALAGRQFVIRYHSRTTRNPGKRISPREAALLARAGLSIATVYQDNARLPADFGADRGELDGRSAYAAAAAIGQPPDSAIYFAVDADFSEPQIRSFVLPYFEGVRRGLAAAAGGASPYGVGVYGSGLACRLVRDEAALARFAWLAVAAGWRESRTYAGWDVRQSHPAGDLCGLGATGWESCESAGPFGEFQPIGFAVTAQEGVRRSVTASQLNLRRAPTTAGEVITRLPEGQVVRLLGPAGGAWVRVRATVAGGEVIGYVHGSHLAEPAAAPALAAAVPAPGSLPPVHYRPGDPASRRNSAGQRAKPLGEPQMPRCTATSAPEKAQQLQQVIDWLDVQNSLRYRKEASGATYCNVYAADYCYLAGAYLPRTWWTGPALVAIGRGETPPVIYDGTVREMQADDLYDWLARFGPAFGWRRVFDTTALQAAADAGGIGVIVADRLQPGRSGHISVVVPETGAQQARRDPDGNVIYPLQSQAGETNLARSTIGKAWWNDPKFAAADGFFVHE
ncbi:DUF1906 domain-containing protein [Ramlibacter tataouinensis]|uniref:glycoside hydrolase domain-containing protein n=1 Tax=Ramlibacter tataouinensis TaxID=94132 RepID=UPI0022F3B9E5|nr:glycoside hydrolase domain-containing protein [Ramlibacter tataouinensis]WBY03280.1 DUF1906 domain-containing protein [Ramlibacter tataouinensis]